MNKQLVVISFTGALYGIKRGQLTEEMLSQALFYFGCVREHALEPWAPNPDGQVFDDLLHVSDDKKERESIHGILVRSLLAAEEKGNVAWRSFDEHNSYQAFNALLVKAGFEPIKFAYLEQDHYNYPTVQRAVEESGQALEVFWRPTR